MPMRRDSHLSLVVSSSEYFHEVVDDAFTQRKFQTVEPVKNYLVELLQFYVPAANLFDEVDSSGRRTRQTLAETFLKAQNAPSSERIELLKKLADRSLYISGFFGDSLQRKLVDVDYYVDMGGMAYGALATSVRTNTQARVYSELAQRFFDFVEVLTHISSRTHLQNEENLMRLFEIYAKTGSEVAREKLVAKGLTVVPADQAPLKKPQ
jgi:hypothetical protein